MREVTTSATRNWGLKYTQEVIRKKEDTKEYR